MSYFSALEKELEKYLSTEEIALCFHAYQVAEQAHAGQMRRSGEPYISHPIGAAIILARMHLDCQTIMATLLHDVVEDTSVSYETLRTLFGDEVAGLVDGVTKLTQIKFESRAQAKAEYFRKMVLAMVKDIRVIIVKLADRYHNMSSLGVMPASKRRRIAFETLDIYAPIANRLGMHKLYIGLEDLGFQALYPMRHRVIQSAVARVRGNRRALMHKIEQDMAEAVEALAIPYENIFGRRKHLYGIYRKMRKKKTALAEITDVFAFRVITDSIDSCYRVLGALHQIYKPIPQRFKDYIGIPKVNGYQSLHTTLFGPYGVPLEVQIRTREMDRVAKHGVAAHWIYKSSCAEINEAELRAREWVKRLMDIQRSSRNSLEFIEHVKVDLFPDEIYVFTPKGEILELPKGATPVDFAYMVHSDVGHQCVAAKVNRRFVPLSFPLANGQTVEIVTAPYAKPNPAWINFVVTGRAKSNIRHFLKNQQHEESLLLGRRMLIDALRDVGADYDKIPPESLKHLLEDLGYKSVDDLLIALSTGKQMAIVIAKRLVHAPEEGNTESAEYALAIQGTEGMVLHYADCCQPIPGDRIVGRFERGRGITVHVSDCPRVNPVRGKPQLLVPLRWDPNVVGEYDVDIVAEVTNQRGVLASLTASISDSQSNISNIHVNPRDGRHNTLLLSIMVRDHEHLLSVLRRLKTIKTVVSIHRRKPEEL